MLVFNQQANIKNVNGAIADIFANRPAPQTTYYLFYSTDTQEIFYDNGAWILLGSGGGAVNIYNSNGTLTGNRELSGSGNELKFKDLLQFYVQTSAFNTGQFALTDTEFKTIYNTNINGIKIDFVNKIYELGQITGGNNAFIEIDDTQPRISTKFFGATLQDGLNIVGNQFADLGFNSTTNLLKFSVSDIGNEIYTLNSNGVNGIRLDFGNTSYKLGQITGGNTTYLEINDNSIISTNYQNNEVGLKFVISNQEYFFGDFANINNGSTLFIDDNNSIIKTVFGGNDIGLKLDFLNRLYQLGEPQTGDIILDIDGNNGLLKSVYTTNDEGVLLDFINKQYYLGKLSAGNTTYLEIDDTNQLIKTINQSSDIGLKLDFANQVYILGDPLLIGNGVEFLVDNGGYRIVTRNGSDDGILIDFSSYIFKFGAYTSLNTTHLEINDNAQYIKTLNQGNDIGLKLDFANEIYEFGQLTGGNTTKLTIDDTNSYIQANFGGFFNGLNLEFGVSQYEFGELVSGNTTHITIDDAAAYPVQIDGTNILSASSGGSSGQHLKIKLNGVDYKIKLENP